MMQRMERPHLITNDSTVYDGAMIGTDRPRRRKARWLNGRSRGGVG